MIFRPELARLVMRGKKTETRRLIGVPTLKQRGRNRPSYVSTPWRPKVGHREPVQPGRGKHALGHIVITAFEQQALRDLTPAAAIAEGFRNRPEFARYWMSLHGDLQGGSSTFNPDAWTHDGDTLEWWLAEWGDTIVWAVTFEVERDLPRWLVPASTPEIDTTPRHPGTVAPPTRDTDLGYTNNASNAMPDEGPHEAIDAATQERYSKVGREAHALRRLNGDAEQLAAKRTLEQRLGVLRGLALERGVDVRSDLRVVQGRLDAMERKILNQRAGAA